MAYMSKLLPATRAYAEHNARVTRAEVDHHIKELKVAGAKVGIAINMAKGELPPLELPYAGMPTRIEIKPKHLFEIGVKGSPDGAYDQFHTMLAVLDGLGEADRWQCPPSPADPLGMPRFKDMSACGAKFASYSPMLEESGGARLSALLTLEESGGFTFNGKTLSPEGAQFPWWESLKVTLTPKDVLEIQDALGPEGLSGYFASMANSTAPMRGVGAMIGVERYPAFVDFIEGAKPGDIHTITLERGGRSFAQVIIEKGKIFDPEAYSVRVVAAEGAFSNPQEAVTLARQFRDLAVSTEAILKGLEDNEPILPLGTSGMRDGDGKKVK